MKLRHFDAQLATGIRDEMLTPVSGLRWRSIGDMATDLLVIESVSSEKERRCSFIISLVTQI
jgi:hypothetical protein